MAEQSELKKMTGKYVGRELSKEGDDWKRYKTKFETEKGTRTFGAFFPWTKKDGTPKKGTDLMKLEEGEYYDISYKEQEIEGMDFPLKTAVCFFHSDGTKQEKLTPASGKSWSDAEIVAFKKPYESACRKKNIVPNEKHFLGAFLWTKDSTRRAMYTKITDIYNNNERKVEEPDV